MEKILPTQDEIDVAKVTAQLSNRGYIQHRHLCDWVTLDKEGDQVCTARLNHTFGHPYCYYDGCVLDLEYSTDSWVHFNIGVGHNEA